MHVGVCAQATVPAQAVERLRQEARIHGAAFVKLGADGTVTPVPPADVQAKFDKRAYQREYMRKRRAEKAK